MYRETVLGCIILALIIGAFLGLMVLGMTYKCDTKWPDKFNPEYGIVTGCTIEVEEGRIPAENYRVL